MFYARLDLINILYNGAPFFPFDAKAEVFTPHQWNPH